MAVDNQHRHAANMSDISSYIDRERESISIDEHNLNRRKQNLQLFEHHMRHLVEPFAATNDELYRMAQHVPADSTWVSQQVDDARRQINPRQEPPPVDDEDETT